MNPAGDRKSDASLSDNIYDNTSITFLPGGIRPGGLPLTGHLFDLCGFEPGDRILDAGCGFGTSLDFISRKKIYNTVGIDLSGSMLKKGHKDFPDLYLVQGNVVDLPFTDNSFNGVISECSLSVMGDPVIVLTEIKRVLVEKGKFALSDIYLRHPEEAENLKKHSSGDCISGAFIYDELAKMLTESGFNIILWEDHTDLWKEFVAEFIINNISGCRIMTGGDYKGKSMDEWLMAVSKVKPGYFTLVAEKL